MRKIISVILIFIFVCGILVSVCYVNRIWSEQRKSADHYTELKDSVIDNDPSDKEEEISTPPSESDTVYTGQQIDFQTLSVINPDVVGWIVIDGTPIDYPVVQGTDNSYYLKHLFDGKWNSSGCIFMDYRVSNTLSDRHTVIYGHHMKNGSMFSSLSGYKKQSFYNEHPTALFIQEDTVYRIEFFSGYVSKVDSDAWKVNFADDSEFEQWINKVQSQSYFDSDTVPAVNDRIITLSTCSYEFDNARFVIHGILREIS